MKLVGNTPRARGVFAMGLSQRTEMRNETSRLVDTPCVDGSPGFDAWANTARSRCCRLAGNPCWRLSVSVIVPSATVAPETAPNWLYGIGLAETIAP